MSASNATTWAMPVIKSQLIAIATQLKTTITTLAPTLVGAALPLAAGEVEALLEALAELESIVFNIKTTLSATLSTVKAGKLPSPIWQVSSCEASVLTDHVHRRQRIDPT